MWPGFGRSLSFANNVVNRKAFMMSWVSFYGLRTCHLDFIWLTLFGWYTYMKVIRSVFRALPVVLTIGVVKWGSLTLYLLTRSLLFPRIAQCKSECIECRWKLSHNHDFWILISTRVLLQIFVWSVNCLYLPNSTWKADQHFMVIAHITHYNP